MVLFARAFGYRGSLCEEEKEREIIWASNGGQEGEFDHHDEACRQGESNHHAVKGWEMKRSEKIQEMGGRCEKVRDFKIYG